MYSYEEALTLALILVGLAFLLLVVVVRRRLKPGKPDVPEADIGDFQKSAKNPSFNSDRGSRR